MSYQVLARKYRPKGFDTLVGQEHVVRALSHALDSGRLHHAYLFTGTRGVGKTTLSRILAKAFNCVGPDGTGGVTSQPCGACDACVAIDAGRFVDYIEIDAASNRGVDEMAQLLEQAVYAPSNARFKVYMIDEVHMLTNHAFNAMLKTLEEPPPHVKFILATTDPQKIPVTVLSRCLQFNLKQMPPAQIVAHLTDILGQEAIAFETPALRLLAQGAHGSMRDALSLTDQAIAYAAGNVTLDAVQGMLGALDQSFLVRILDVLAQRDGAALVAIADDMAARSLSYNIALQDLGSLLHRVALAQTVPAAIADDLPERADILRLARLFDADEVQLHYQIVVHGRNELGLAPDDHAGFSMTLLRMLAFRPQVAGNDGGATPPPPPATGRQSAIKATGVKTVAETAPGPASAPLTAASPVARDVVGLLPISPAPPAPPSLQSPAATVIALAKPSMPAVSSNPPAPENVTGLTVPVAPVATAVPAVPAAPATPVRPAGALSPARAALQAARSGAKLPPLPESAAAPSPPSAKINARMLGAIASTSIAGRAGPATVALMVAAPDLGPAPPWDDAGGTASLAAMVTAQPASRLVSVSSTVLPHAVMPAAPVVTAAPVIASAPIPVPVPVPAPALGWDGDWPALTAVLSVRGVVQQLAQQSELIEYEKQGDANCLTLQVAVETLRAAGTVEKLSAALSEHFTQPVKVATRLGAVSNTAHLQALAAQAERQRQAEQTMHSDPFVQTLIREFGATIVPGSIKPNTLK